MPEPTCDELVQKIRELEKQLVRLQAVDASKVETGASIKRLGEVEASLTKAMADLDFPISVQGIEGCDAYDVVRENPTVFSVYAKVAQAENAEQAEA